MQAPSAPDEDVGGDFDLVGWVPPHFDDDAGRYLDEIFERAEAFVLGRRPYAGPGMGQIVTGA